MVEETSPWRMRREDGVEVKEAEKGEGDKLKEGEKSNTRKKRSLKFKM